MMRVLVTGSNGQLGMSLRKIAGESHDFVFTDINDIPGQETVRLDITDKDAVMSMVCGEEKVDVIVNCAAYTNVDRAEEDSMTAELINSVAASNLAVAAKESGAVLVHISTDYVFGGDACVPYGEECGTDPKGVYGKTKLAGELAVKASGCMYIIIRTSWLYSPYGKNFVKTMRQLTSGKESLKVVFDQAGSPTFAGDLAGFIYGIIDNDMLDRSGVYHYSNEGVCSWYDFAVAIRDLSGNVCDISPCHSYEFPSRVERPHYSVLDKTRVKEVFGIRVPYWMDSLKHCIDELENTGLK